VDALQALADLYAYPEPLPHDGWVRACMVSTIDGSAVDEHGSSRGISDAVDRTLLGVLRALADVVLVGAGTVRAEGYAPIRPRPAFAERRAAAGQAPAPPVAVVTRSGELDDLTDLLEPDSTTLVLTTTSAPLGRLRSLAPGRVVLAGEDDVDPVTALAALADRGLRRVQLEGGPRLLGCFVAGGCLDELCLTWSPLLVVGDGPRIDSGPAARRPLRLAHLAEAGGLLLGRWLVARDATTPIPG
jgi:riboflavin biosynthesis pyrimidine reductase